MDNSSKTTNFNNSQIKKSRKSATKKKEIKSLSTNELDNVVEPIVATKQVNYMARRYELAYTKLYSQLPLWKQVSFKNVSRKDDTLYNEFIASVIALAEDVNDPILLTA